MFNLFTWTKLHSVIIYHDDIAVTLYYTDIMKTQALKQALTKYGFTAAFGGGRRDEEKSRAKERIFSFRNKEAWSHTGYVRLMLIFRHPRFRM